MELFKKIKDMADIPKIMNWEAFEYEPSKEDPKIMQGYCFLCEESDATKNVKFNTENKVFYCFKCHKGGDVITYVALRNKCSIIDAARWINGRYRLGIPEHEFDDLAKVKTA